MSITVDEFMSRSVICVDENVTIKKASRLMAEKGVSSLLVKNNNEISGIITENDIVSKFISMDIKPSVIFVYEIMSSPIIKIRKNETIKNAINIMINNNIKKLPIFDEKCDKVMGIISIYDIITHQPELISSIHKGYDKKNQHIRHDIRGALLTLNSSIALMELNPEQTKKCIDIMKKSTGYMKNILEEWKTNEEKMVVNLEKVDIRVIMETALKTVYLPDFIKTKISITGKEEVYLDTYKIMRVLSNLIKNSVESIAEKGVIEIHAIVDPENVIFKIKDSGKGISPEIIDRIFDPMFSTKSSGLGLGLSFVQNVVNAHGGTISVISEIDIGTEFTLMFPNIQYNSQV